MNKLKNAHKNFELIKPIIDGLDEEHDHRRYEVDGFDPLSVEYLHYTDRNGNPVYSVMHYYMQNGDLMRDPDMTVAVDFEQKTVEPLTYEQSAFGLYQEVYRTGEDGKLMYSPRLRNDLDEFLRNWLRSIHAQAFLTEYAKVYD